MKAFADLTDDERAEWRSSPVTQAFIAWMASEAKAMEQGVMEAIRGPDAATGMHIAGMYAGKAAAYQRAIDTATRSFEE